MEAVGAVVINNLIVAVPGSPVGRVVRRSIVSDNLSY